MHCQSVLSRDWKGELQNVFLQARNDIIISSPYVTEQGTNFVLANLRQEVKAKIRLRILTNLSPVNIYQGSTDPVALKLLALALPHFTLLHLPKLHAKVYVVDHKIAIVTSANLTAGGLERNYEYGIKISDPRIVKEIAQDIISYSDLGAMISPQNLDNYSLIADRLRNTYKKQQNSIVKSVRKEFEKEILSAEDELMRMRLAGGAMHTVFAKTILYLLKRYGPLSTEQMHPKIEVIHPDLCDNTIDRVIDGKHFGKKWKHAVRTAQQQLKKKGLVFLDGDLWMLTA